MEILDIGIFLPVAILIILIVLYLRQNRKNREVIVLHEVVNLVYIEERKILLCRKNETWILPGGKKEKNESDKQTLTRECAEEISVKINILKLYGIFHGYTPHKKYKIRVIVYMGKAKGNPKASTEIQEIGFFTAQAVENLKVSDTTIKIIGKLKKEGYL